MTLGNRIQHLIFGVITHIVYENPCNYTMLPNYLDIRDYFDSDVMIPCDGFVVLVIAAHEYLICQYMSVTYSVYDYKIIPHPSHDNLELIACDKINGEACLSLRMRVNGGRKDIFYAFRDNENSSCGVSYALVI